MGSKPLRDLFEDASDKAEEIFETTPSCSRLKHGHSPVKGGEMRRMSNGMRPNFSNICFNTG